MYSGATFTIEQNLACLQVILGRTSAGAAGAGNRYGLVVQNGGTKITFDGAAAITNSGIYANPTSADASSKGCKVTISGTSASKAQWDVSVQWDTNYRFQLHMRYGYCDIDYLQILANTSYTSGVYQIVTYPHTTYAPEGVTFKINHVEFPHIYGTAVYLGADTSGDRNLSFEAKYCIMDTYSNWMHIFICDNCYGTISSGDIDFTGFTWISNSASSHNKALFRTFIQSLPLYISNNRASFVNNLPTQVVPTTPDATDPGTNGDLTVTWDNGASYAAGDKVVVYNNAGGAVLGILDATAGTGIITGLTNELEYTMYLKATSDNYNFSDETATFTETPTAGTVPVFTGTWTIAKASDYNRIEIDLSPCTITGADKINAYIKEVSTPATGAATDFATAEWASETTVYIYGKRGAPLSANATYHVKLGAENEAGEIINATEETIVPAGYLSLS